MVWTIRGVRFAQNLPLAISLELSFHPFHIFHIFLSLQRNVDRVRRPPPVISELCKRGASPPRRV